MLGMLPKLTQARWACLLFICQASFAHGVVTSVQPIACSQIVADMGPFYRWPKANPGMVAPVNIVWKYPKYQSPLRSSFTGKSIQIDIPADFGEHAGFHLGTSGKPKNTDEEYRLARVELRKPAQAYAGLGQQLSHVMEMVLVHKQHNGKHWANIILPFQVSTSGADMDIINPIVDGTKLPRRIGESGYVMASAVNKMILSPAFENATFNEFWGKAPVAGCNKKDVDVRFFMRTDTLSLGVDTFQQMSTALENAPNQQPVQPAEATWIVGSCSGADPAAPCVPRKAQDMQAKLKNLEQFQTRAITQQRDKKSNS